MQYSNDGHSRKSFLFQVYFLSARVHPGETPASFVFNGFLDFILRRNDPRAMMLREKYVFKLIPMLNPDGVKKGHYRTDSRGVNLNRVYLEPDPVLHPTIYAAKSVIMYHHGKGQEIKNKICKCEHKNNNLPDEKSNEKTDTEKQIQDDDNDDTLASLTQSCDLDDKNVAELGERMPLDGIESNENITRTTSDDGMTIISAGSPDFDNNKNEASNNEDNHKDSTCCESDSNGKENADSASDNRTVDEQQQSGNTNIEEIEACSKELSAEASDINGNINTCKCFSETNDKTNEGPLEYYVDLHGHASKRGCFVYGNYLENEDNYVQGILYPKLMSINSANFDFTGCNFTEKNMYSKDKRDGMSKEGSGRVAILKATSIVHR